MFSDSESDIDFLSTSPEIINQPKKSILLSRTEQKFREFRTVKHLPKSGRLLLTFEETHRNLQEK